MCGLLQEEMSGNDSVFIRRLGLRLPWHLVDSCDAALHVTMHRAKPSLTKNYSAPNVNSDGG